MTNVQKMEHILKTIREFGPTRVVINSEGEATSPARAKIDSDVVFIRNDGWTLGAPSRFEEVARQMWADMWIGVSRRPFVTVEELGNG